MPRHIGTCFRFYTQMQVEKKKKKAFAYKIYSHFTQQCRQLHLGNFWLAEKWTKQINHYLKIVPPK